jgi:hypothetical protein
MRIECPHCRRVLVYTGEHPSFCAYCGAVLARPGEAASEVDTDPELTGPHPTRVLTETVEYHSLLSTAAPAAPEEIPERIAGYRLIRKLGSGGMGTVFEAEDEAQAQRVAIKLIAKDHVSSREAVERFRQEGRLASAVTHPRCVFVLSVDDHLGRPYIVMELMPGTTLQTLVEERGPLETSSAIVKIFDVIEGLQQFHKLGLIHRDVKPSNCFLDKEGRVKIGDFGLGKALEGGADLTRTGTFVGTPLYASPEQIKRDEVDERTDVYSVAATLYYLLAGRPPVQAKDAAEALARIASEPAPPLRSYRPDIPRVLEAVIHRGLEREAARRWRNLQEFHDALLPFVPDRLSIAGIGLRVGAFAIDVCLSYLVSWAIFGLVILYHRAEIMETFRFYEEHQYALGWCELVFWFFYFAVLEGIGAASLGKWLAGLRVSRTGRGGPPGLARGLVRASVFYALTEIPSIVLEELTPPIQGRRMLLSFWIDLWIIKGLGLLALVSTMREKSGFRGPHEWLSGTRVVRAARRRRPRRMWWLRAMADSRLASAARTPAPERIHQVGPYAVRGAVRWEPGHRILMGHDSTLERPVWIVVRDSQAPPPPLARRVLNRRSRPRWIGGGVEDFGRWDAFTAPSGFPLSDLVKGGGLSWRDSLPLLRELAEELEVACHDGTLPRLLSPAQVWIEPDGGMQLIDILVELPEAGSAGPEQLSQTSTSSESAGSSSGDGTPDPEELRGLLLVGEVARLALEGSCQPGESPSELSRVDADGRSEGLDGKPAGRTRLASAWRIRAAVPERARFLLERLTGVRVPYSSLSGLRTDLDAAAGRPMEISLARRGIQLSFQTFFLLPGLFLMFFLSSEFIRPRLFPWDLETVIAIPIAWVFWAIIARGGLSFTLAGIALVRRDGLRASRLACGWRALLVWALPTALLASSRYLQETAPEAMGLALRLWIGAVLLLVAYVALALLFPRRCLHDQMAGTLLVPL